MEGEIIYPYCSLDKEISNFIKVWVSVSISRLYCKFTSKIIPKGLPRLLTFFPVVCLFLYLPLHLHSAHLGGMTSFFIAWLSNFKLLLLAFDKGPLSDPTLSPSQFLAIGCFPIRKTEPKNPRQESKQGHKPVWNYILKGLLLAAFVQIYHYSEHIHPKFILVIYSFHIYFLLELMLAVVAALVRATLGLQLEPQFNEPYLSTSLQDFWGSRWNMMVPRALRPTVYNPTLSVWTWIVGRESASLPAVLAAFVVSAVMHELMFYYLGRKRPNWEITWFFILHGVCLVVEIATKKALKGRYRLPPVISTTLTVGFVMVTGFWLFFPPFLRCKPDARAFKEYAILGAFVKDVVLGGAVKLRHFNGSLTSH
ncbi:acyl-CoA--sterol O-acyltransferase 1-like [Rhododendron vialii]|uniref:acyl-CoA--sterol O-acyltransferase 1-like n=1 Tax=Rhododendron vialii TaxID=182163 RepID=UPI0026602D99|nr:acyl-CoA--sterol O-acyltransferase 1-like [Rhododendron vialii]